MIPSIYYCVVGLQTSKGKLHVETNKYSAGWDQVFANALASTKFGSTVAMCFPARDVARCSTPTTASTDTISLCVASLTTGGVLPLLHMGQGHLSEKKEERNAIEKNLKELNLSQFSCLIHNKEN